MLHGCVRTNQIKRKAKDRQNWNPSLTGRKRKLVHAQLAVKNVWSVLLQSTWITQEHCYLIVMISPGFAWMYQLQLTRAGYSEGHPGLVIVPLGDRICSGISPQAEIHIYIESNLINSLFFKTKYRTNNPTQPDSNNQRKYQSGLDDVPIKKPTTSKGVCNGTCQPKDVFQHCQCGSFLLM